MRNSKCQLDLFSPELVILETFVNSVFTCVSESQEVTVYTVLDNTSCYVNEERSARIKPKIGTNVSHTYLVMKVMWMIHIMTQISDAIPPTVKVILAAVLIFLLIKAVVLLQKTPVALSMMKMNLTLRLKMELLTNRRKGGEEKKIRQTGWTK